MFLVFPLNSKPDWLNPPWMTILLIMVNCLVYFGPQRADEQAWQRGVDFYAQSDLPALEFPRYAAYLRQSDNPERRELAGIVEHWTSAADSKYLSRFMERDLDFQAALHAGRIVRPDQAEYARWFEQRAHFDQVKGSGFTARWSSNPADWRPLTALTATFLHGSAAHLIGNMVFLFLFGYTVEVALGRRRYLAYCWCTAALSLTGVPPGRGRAWSPTIAPASDSASHGWAGSTTRHALPVCCSKRHRRTTPCRACCWP